MAKSQSERAALREAARSSHFGQEAYHIGRIFAVFGVLMTLAACGVGVWVAARPPMKLLVVPGARGVEVVALGWGTWQKIRY